MLETAYANDKFPSIETRKALAADLKVKPRQVQVWFQNKRQREKTPGELMPPKPSENPNGGSRQSSAGGLMPSTERTMLQRDVFASDAEHVDDPSPSVFPSQPLLCGPLVSAPTSHVPQPAYHMGSMPQPAYNMAHMAQLSFAYYEWLASLPPPLLQAAPAASREMLLLWQGLGMPPAWRPSCDPSTLPPFDPSALPSFDPSAMPSMPPLDASALPPFDASAMNAMSAMNLPGSINIPGAPHGSALPAVSTPMGGGDLMESLFTDAMDEMEAIEQVLQEQQHQQNQQHQQHQQSSVGGSNGRSTVEPV